jgi:4-hydroxybenzoate polyprenyltransferase
MKQRFLSEQILVSRGFLCFLVFLFTAILFQTWGSAAMLIGYLLFWFYSMALNHYENQKAWATIKKRKAIDNTHPWED